MSSWTEEYHRMIRGARRSPDKLTDWETNFLSDISRRLDSGKTLSGKQITTLESIWDKVERGG